MKDEIKEILYMLKSVIDEPKKTFCANATTCYVLLDYITNLQKNYERIYNENCKLREKHNITDISLLDENNRLQEKIKNILNKLKESAIWYDDSKDLLDYITNLQEENKELKMTNLALADDITKNKIIKQDVLTHCCGIPIGEIPMLKIKNDDYKQRIDKAIEYINKNKFDFEKWETQMILNILQGKSDK